MNNRDRVLKSLNHEQPDRVPFFYWGVPGFTEKMMKHLGFSDKDQLLEHLDVDFRWVEPNYRGPELLDISGESKRDIWGVEYKLCGHGDLKYWDIAGSPLAGVNDPAVLADYPWPDVSLFDFNSLNRQLDKYSKYATMSAPGYSSPGLYRIIQRLIGRDNFLEVMMYHPKFFGVLVEKVSDFYCDFISSFFEVAGERLDFIRIADDFGDQGGLIVSNDTWQDIIRPVMERFMEVPRKHHVKFYMHSCGAVRKLLPEFISIGADVLDPIQTRAAGMSPEGLKKDFGSMITFCGALDEELLLRKATPARVKEGVKELLDIMAPGGGFFLGPSHKFKVETPVENVIAMYEAAREWKY
ncbi:uroporphyrinogen decarboxylase family protein [Natronoflexus pectinivorans]|uniref:Uroporphyrinogen decarboxylase n=1 Tax=Natronoflexus pectinivorans TaxID=682526 RepID=A0A4R2G4S8_9BACT|nr:uroporphyrinogen decarboxylase family protein [Natronoflexus pectinivorans]TCO02707.1 uroporphyrinogen decarboxylase [Natronoflexus pectinivorans]